MCAEGGEEEKRGKKEAFDFAAILTTTFMSHVSCASYIHIVCQTNGADTQEQYYYEQQTREREKNRRRKKNEEHKNVAITHSSLSTIVQIST